MSKDWWSRDNQKEIFIDRDGAIFSYILSYLRDGTVALPITVRKVALMKELNYYGVDDIDADSIDDESSEASEVESECKVVNVRETAIIYGIVVGCINKFLSVRGSPNQFTHRVVAKSNHDISFNWLKSNCTSSSGKLLVFKKLNEHLHKIGLKVIDTKISFNGGRCDIKMAFL